jgi:hypothetical protein
LVEVLSENFEGDKPMKKGDKCYNMELICPHQIDNEPCGYCEYRPNKILIFTGEIPENPCEECSASPKNDPQAFDGCEVAWNCRQRRECLIECESILNQCVEVDIDELYHRYNAYRAVIASGGKCCVNYDSFSQFIQEQIKKQEGKNGNGV